MKESLVLAIFTVGLAASGAASAAGAVPPDYVPPSASSAGVPPDYNPNTATTVTAPRGFTPPSAVSQVPPDTQNSRTTTATDGRVTTTTTYPPTPIIKTESGVLNSLKPRAPQLPLSEQIDLGRNRGSLGKLRFSAACAGDGRAGDDSLVDQHKVGDMHFGPHDTHLDEEISLRIRAGADSTFEIHA